MVILIHRQNVVYVVTGRARRSASFATSSELIMSTGYAVHYAD